MCTETLKGSLTKPENTKMHVAKEPMTKMKIENTGVKPIPDSPRKAARRATCVNKMSRVSIH